MKYVLTIALCLSASGFAANPSQECAAKIAENPAFSPLASKMSLSSAKSQTFQMLANTELASESEKPLIAAWAEEKDRCMKEGESWRKVNAPPSIIPLINTSHSEGMALAADLYAGKITYGQFAKMRQAISDKYDAEASREIQRLNERTAASNEQANAERRRVAAGMLLNQQQTKPYQMQPYQMQAPTQTNCTAFGNQLNCTTH